MRRRDSTQPPPKPRPRRGRPFMPWPIQAATVALIAALGFVALGD